MNTITKLIAVAVAVVVVEIVVEVVKKKVIKETCDGVETVIVQEGDTQIEKFNKRYGVVN